VADNAETKKRTGPITFLQQVRTEARKVTWTTRQETVAATILVVIMVLVAALFFMVTDAIVVFLVRMITQVGSLNG
jgi:preprotein translocase subunit SecE